MSHTPLLIQDLTLILGLAAVVSIIFYKIRQPSILGFLLVGIISGPYTPGPIVADVNGIKVWAEIGVIFLLFSMGLHFRMTDFFKGERRSLLVSGISLPTMFLLGGGVARYFGFSWMICVIWGFLVSFSSSVVVASLLGQDALDSKGPEPRLLMRTLLIEDFVAIIIMTALASVAAQPQFSLVDILRSTLQLILVITSWVILGRFALPRMFRIPLASNSNEILVLSAVAVCFMMVSFASTLGYSVALAAFIVGSLLAEMPDGQKLAQVVEPLRDVFGAVFFISMGMLLDIHQISNEWRLILMMTMVVVVGKSLLVYYGAKTAGLFPHQSSFVAAKMGNIGEFSIILASAAGTVGLFPEGQIPVVIAVAVLSLFLMPAVCRAYRV
jgi:CPA2 family monovalent cation:H+ antiporter-2